jgi:hypothetical protein
MEFDFVASSATPPVVVDVSVVNIRSSTAPVVAWSHMPLES